MKMLCNYVESMSNFYSSNTWGTFEFFAKLLTKETRNWNCPHTHTHTHNIIYNLFAYQLVAIKQTLPTPKYIACQFD